jgi:uncharacterized protein YllA (UPF0747 family)
VIAPALRTSCTRNNAAAARRLTRSLQPLDCANRTQSAVVTGQQAGLFGGPLFTLLKAITAVQLAERVTAQHKVPAVAIFWIDAEDHDWDEVKSCGVLDAAMAHRTVTVGDPPGAHAEPVARVCLDDSIDRAMAELSRLLPPTEFSPALFETLRGAYHQGAGMAEAFGRWLESILGPRGLVVYDSADPAAKRLVAGRLCAGDRARRRNRAPGR